MSIRNDLPGEGKLPLPSPRSPAELDERIINAARERAPRPRPRRQPWWMAGAATACVLVVAVMLVRPQQPAPQSESDVSSAPMASKMRAAKNVNDDSNTVTIQKLELRHYSEEESQSIMEVELSDQSPSHAAGAAKERSNAELSKRLSVLADLIKDGNEDTAIAAYEQLKQEFTDSNLPETLKEALAEHQL